MYLKVSTSGLSSEYNLIIQNETTLHLAKPPSLGTVRVNGISGLQLYASLTVSFSSKALCNHLPEIMLDLMSRGSKYVTLKCCEVVVNR